MGYKLVRTKGRTALVDVITEANRMIVEFNYYVIQFQVVTGENGFWNVIMLVDDTSVLPKEELAFKGTFTLPVEVAELGFKIAP
jgi:hypothetical protein